MTASHGNTPKSPNLIWWANGERSRFALRDREGLTRAVIVKASTPEKGYRAVHIPYVHYTTFESAPRQVQMFRTEKAAKEWCFALATVEAALVPQDELPF